MLRTRTRSRACWSEFISAAPAPWGCSKVAMSPDTSWSERRSWKTEADCAMPLRGLRPLSVERIGAGVPSVKRTRRAVARAALEPYAPNAPRMRRRQVDLGDQVCYFARHLPLSDVRAAQASVASVVASVFDVLRQPLTAVCNVFNHLCEF